MHTLDGLGHSMSVLRATCMIFGGVLDEVASEPCSEVTSGCFQEVSKCTVACVTLLCSHHHPLQDSPPSQTDADPLDTHTPPKPRPTCCLCESGSSGISDEWVLQDQSLSARLVLGAACSADLPPSVCLITRRLWAGAPGADCSSTGGFRCVRWLAPSCPWAWSSG